ncbi:MAG: hypothetical protein AB1782_04190, partial [Cyanobacteriota bacterium]
LQELLTKTKNDKKQIEELSSQFETLTASGELKAADQIAKQMTTINRNNKLSTNATRKLIELTNAATADINNKINQANELANKGEIDRAISVAEEAVIDSQKLVYSDSLYATTKNLVQDLKNKKFICENNINEAKRLIKVHYYVNAKDNYESAKKVLANHPEVIEVGKILDEYFSNAKKIKQQQVELTKNAYILIEKCDYDQAAEMINEAKALNPDDEETSRAAYDVNNKRTIVYQDFDRTKVHVDGRNVSIAQEQLEKYRAKCSNHPKFIEAQKYIDDFYNSKTRKELEGLIAELEDATKANDLNRMKTVIQKLLNRSDIPEDLRQKLIDLQQKIKLQEEQTLQLEIDSKIFKVQTLVIEKNFQGARQLASEIKSNYKLTLVQQNRLNEIINSIKNIEIEALLEKARQLVTEGKLGVAMNDYAYKAYNLDTSNIAAKNYYDKLVREHTIVMNCVTQVMELGKQAKVTEAKIQLDKAESLHPKYEPVVAAREYYNRLLDWKNKQQATYPPQTTNNINKVKEYLNSTSGNQSGISNTPSKPVRINYNGNTGGCSFTDTARFNLPSTSFVTDIKLWFNWQQNQSSISYNFYGPSGLIKSGTMKRGDCDTYQKSWCNAEDYIGKNLSAGSYTVKASIAKICQNSGTAGNGTISVFSGPPRTNTVSTPSTPTTITRPTTPTTITRPTTPTNTTVSSNFDGTYRGSVSNDDQVSGTIEFNIRGGKVSGNAKGGYDGASFNTDFHGQINPQNGRIDCNLANSYIKDDELKMTFPFTGNLTGTISGNQGSGRWDGHNQYGDPSGYWKASKVGYGTSVPSTTKPPIVKSSPKNVYLVFKNQSSMPVHFYGIGQRCAPDNKIMPGGQVNSSLRMAMQLTKYYVGRNGQTIGTVELPLNSVTSGQTITLIYSSSGQFYWAK